jgi:ATP-binding cassette subfamily B protein
MNRAIYLNKDSRKRRGIKIPINQYFKVLSKYLRGHVPVLVFLGFLMFGGVAVQLINPQIIRGFIDAARAGEEMALLLRRTALFFGMIVLLQIIHAFSNYVGQVIDWTSTNDLRADVAECCLRLDMSFHYKHKPGELIERIDGDIALLSRFFSEFSVDLIGSLLFAVGVIAMLFREDWCIGCAFLVYAVLALAVFSGMRNIAILSRKRFREQIARQTGFIQEHLA